MLPTIAAESLRPVDLQASADEAPFLIGELFFSRTDPRGMILAANAVFQRISGYGWDDLLKAPHRIIRHPDMPRGVFHLMWERIKAGRPTGAYVKNRARDGRYYWVFAIVTPVEGGYLSVRLKPTSQLLPTVRHIYAELRAGELAGSLKPDESAALLLSRLTELGHPGYDSFMAVALAAETRARDAALSRPDKASRSALEAIVTLVRSGLGEVSAMLAAFAEAEIVSSNFRLQASRHGGTHGPLGTIAHNYLLLTSEIFDAITGFSETLAAISQAISNTLFLTETAAIQTEVSEIFRAEMATLTRIDATAEARMLEAQRRAYVLAAAEGFCDVFFTGRRLSEGTNHMHRLVTGLDVARIMCEIETASLGLTGSGMVDIATDLARFQALLGQAIHNLDELNRGLNARFGELAAQEIALDPGGPKCSIADFRTGNPRKIAS